MPVKADDRGVITQVAPGGPRLDAEGKVIPILQQLSREDFGEAVPRIRDDGGICPPQP